MTQKKYYGEQTELALKHFKIGRDVWPKEMIRAQTIVKIAAARANEHAGDLPRNYSRAIQKAAAEILDGTHDNQFPAPLWQTGSGTPFNMNVNEVIASRANEILTGKIHGKAPVHPNDHVNMSQSTNDTVPTAIHIAIATAFHERLLPALSLFERTVAKKSRKFAKIIKVGRTHFQDAVTISLGEEFSGYAAQISFAKNALADAVKTLYQVPLGGTAVGTGLNAPKGYRQDAVSEIRKLTSLPFIPAKNIFENMAQHNRLILVSSALKTAAIALMKIANDIRLMGSGPRAGFAELLLPANEPGSSIMPGKVNPTQAEALMVVCAKVIGNDAAFSTGEMMLSNFELEIAKPLAAHALLDSMILLSDALVSFDTYCARGIEANVKRLKEYEGKSLFAATTMSKTIGYDKAAEMVKKELEKERQS
jgi:fumarate hydratase class II